MVVASSEEEEVVILGVVRKGVASEGATRGEDSDSQRCVSVAEARLRERTRCRQTARSKRQDRAE